MKDEEFAVTVNQLSRKESDTAMDSDNEETDEEEILIEESNVSFRFCPLR